MSASRGLKTAEFRDMFRHKGSACGVCLLLRIQVLVLFLAESCVVAKLDSCRRSVNEFRSRRVAQEHASKLTLL